MSNEIPLEPLLRRLAETPPEFLGEPKLGPIGDVHVAALVHDVLRGLGVSADATYLGAFGADAGAKHRNSQKLVMIAAWLLADPCFTAPKLDATAVRDLFANLVPAIAAQGRSDNYVNDSERREELVRSVLAQLALLPEGETSAHAQDRLSRISSTERMRRIQASRAAEIRAKKVREALARKAAQESADKWTRE